ncbi:MAG: hypothetical protein MUE85_19230, partial [Microscillaceae bacterium]|nr:hypothetical protein [Microscillaceae bacterium]
LFNIFFSSNATPSVPKVATASDYETVKDAFLLMQAENARIERQNRALLWMYNFILSKVDCKHPFYQDDKSISKTDYLKEYKMLFKNGDDTCLVE